MVNRTFYENAKIYRIVCNATGLQYIGSTCKLLCRRLGQHRVDYKRYLNGKYHHITSFKILENNNYDIILIENYPSKSKDELHARERFYIESMDCVNKCIPNRTRKEYREDNKEIIQQYRQDNREKLTKLYQEYRDNNASKLLCACGRLYVGYNKSHHVRSKHHLEYLKLLAFCIDFRRKYKEKNKPAIVEEE